METDILVNVLDMQKGKKPSNLFTSSSKKSRPYILIESFDGNYKQFTEDESCKTCEKDDTLIVWDGARSGLCAFGLEGYLGSTIMALKPRKNKVNPKYLFYFVQSKYDELNKNTQGTGIPHVKKKFFENTTIPLPPLPVQEKIVKKLDKFFEQYEQMKKDNLLIKENQDKILNSFLEQNFGRMPKGSTKLADFIEETEFINPKKSSKKLKYVDISAIDGRAAKIESFKLIDATNAPSRARKLIRKGDIIYATTRPNLKHIATVDSEYDEAVCSTGFCVIRPKDKNLHKLILFYLLTKKAQDYFNANVTGTHYPAISDKKFIALPVSFPKENLSKLSEQITTIHKLRQLIGKEQEKISEACAKLPKAVLSKAFSGKLVS